jgi:hypothetical protein
VLRGRVLLGFRVQGFRLQRCGFKSFGGSRARGLGGLGVGWGGGSSDSEVQGFRVQSSEATGRSSHSGLRG